MPRNGTGTYELPNTVNPVVTDTTITSTWANTTLDDIETELTNSLPRDGQAAPTANLPMGNFKLTGLAAGSASTDSVNYGQVFSSPAFTSPTAVASPAAGDDSLKLATTAFVNDVAMTAALPSQTGNSGKSITTDGTTASWGVSGVTGGGTGINSYTIGDILYASGATALSKLAASTAGYVLTSAGAGAAPVYADPMLTAAAGGTVDAITATFTPALTLRDQQKCFVVCAGANTSTTPTFAPNGLTAHTITARGGAALVVGDIPAAGFVAVLEYNLANTRWELLNPGGNAKSGAVTASGLTQATARLLGRTTASTGAIEEIAVSGATLAGGTLTISAPTAATGASMVLLSTVTASNSATVDVETTFDSTYDAYVIVASGIVTASAADLSCRLKVGGAYDAGANYQYHASVGTSSAATYAGIAGDAATQIVLGKTASAAGHRFDFQMNIHNPSDTTLRKAVYWTGNGDSSGGTQKTAMAFGAGANTATTALTGVRFFASTGNITSGTFRLYGIKNS